MAIYVFGVPKGGVSKTTLSCAFAALLAEEGKKTLLVDADPSNNHSTYWAEDRMELHPELPRVDNIQLSGKSLSANLASQAEHYDDIVVDCGGYDDPAWRYAAAVADKLIMPLKPSQFDTWTFNKAEEGVAQILIVNPDLKYEVLWSQNNPQTNELDEANEMISDFEIKVAPVGFPDRVVHRRAVRSGKTTTEHKDSSSSAASARRELREVYEYFVHDKTPDRLKGGQND